MERTGLVFKIALERVIHIGDPGRHRSFGDILRLAIQENTVTITVLALVTAIVLGGLLTAWGASDAVKRHEFVLYAHADLALPLDTRRFATRAVLGGGGTWWEQVQLPPIAARDHLALNEMLTPTGERRPVEFSDPYPLKGAALDDVFGNLVRDPDGLARFRVEGGGRAITVTYGPKYTVAIVYAPPGKDFICFEPMSAVAENCPLVRP